MPLRSLNSRISQKHGAGRFSWPHLNYHPVQARIDKEDRRFITVPAGRRSGKTTVAMLRACRKAIEPKPWVDQRYGFGAPTRAQAKRLFWRKLKAMFPPECVRDISDGELRIELAHGAELWVVGMDAPERIEGLPWDGWVLDEYANMRPEVWYENVRPSLADRGGWAWKIGVPQGRNHYWELHNRYASDPALRGVAESYSWPSADILPASEIEQLRAEMDERTFRQEMEASFEEAAGRIYYAFDRTKDVHEFPLHPQVGLDSNRPWLGGMDFNVNPLCALWGWEDQVQAPDGRIDTHLYIWDSVAATSADTEEVAAKIRDDLAAQGRWGRFEMYPDPTGRRRQTSAPAGRTDHTILTRLGFVVKARKNSPSRRDRFNSVNTMLCSGDGRRRVHVHPRNRFLIQCLEGALYKEGSNEMDKQKSKDMDHMTDALGYLIQLRYPIVIAARGVSY